MIFTEQVSLFINKLFTDFPREVGFPARKMVNTYDEFLSLAQKYHMESPVFTSLYDVYPHANKVKIDKLWVDQDSFNHYKLLHEAKVIYERMMDLGIEGLNQVIAFTGGKGFHNHTKLNSKIYDIPEAKKSLKYVLSYVCRDLETPDYPLFGDINRIVRVAGIQRPTGSIMFVINPEELFLYPTINDFFIDNHFNYNEIIKNGNKYLKKMKSGANIDIVELAKEIKEETNFTLPKRLTIHQDERTSAIQPMINRLYGVYSEYLKKILKNDALYYAIHAPNPVHTDRIRFAMKLMRMSMDTESIVDIIASLEWMDYNENMTRFYLRDLRDRYL